MEGNYHLFNNNDIEWMEDEMEQKLRAEGQDSLTGSRGVSESTSHLSESLLKIGQDPEKRP